MTSTRTYSKPKEQSVVRAEIERCSGSQFDPDIAKVMLKMIDEDKDYLMNEKCLELNQNIWKGYDKGWSLSTINTNIQPEVAKKQNNIDDSLLKKIEAINEIDIQKGLTHCGDSNTYLETLKLFAESVQDKSSEIEKYWNSGDIKNAVVKVHALKSNARLIGSQSLSEQAAFLEQQGNLFLSGNDSVKEELSKKLPDLLYDYRILGSKIASAFKKPLAEKNVQKPILTKEQFDDALSALREVIGAFNFSTAESIIAELENYTIPEKFLVQYTAIKTKIRALDQTGTMANLG